MFPSEGFTVTMVLSVSLQHTAFAMTSGCSHVGSLFTNDSLKAGHVWCLLSGIAGLSFDSPFLSTRLFFLPSPLALSILSFSMVHSPILVSFFSRIFIFHRELGFIFWLLFMMSRHRLPQTQNDNTHGCVFVILKMSVFNKLEHRSTKKTVNVLIFHNYW